jgi:hypothetical protein
MFHESGRGLHPLHRELFGRKTFMVVVWLVMRQCEVGDENGALLRTISSGTGQ